MDWTASIKNHAQRLRSQARAAVDHTAAEIRDADGPELFASLCRMWATPGRNYLMRCGELPGAFACRCSQWKNPIPKAGIARVPKPSHSAAHADSSTSASGAGGDTAVKPTPSCLWRPLPNPDKAPRLETLRKGQQGYRRGLPARVVQVDYEAHPPALAVCMCSSGNQVGTDSAYVSLGLKASLRCLAVGVRACVVNLRGRTELNGHHGTLLEFKADLGCWKFSLVTWNKIVAVRPQHLSVPLTREPEEAQPTSFVKATANTTRLSEGLTGVDTAAGRPYKPAEELGPAVCPRLAVVTDISSMGVDLDAFGSTAKEPATAGHAELQRPATILTQQIDVRCILTCEDAVAFNVPLLNQSVASGSTCLAAEMVEKPQSSTSNVTEVPPVRELPVADEAGVEVGAADYSQRPLSITTQQPEMPCEGLIVLAAPAAPGTGEVRQDSAAESGAWSEAAQSFSSTDAIAVAPG